MLQSADRLSCEQARDRMDAWIDGDLDAGAAEEVRRHVAVCSACQADRVRAEQLRSGLRSLPDFDLPPHVFEAVMLASRRRSVVAVFAGWWARLLARPVPVVVAFAGVVVLAVVLTPRPEMPPPRPARAEVEAVTSETRLAFAYLGEAARRAEAQVKARVVEDRVVQTTVNGFRRSLSWARRDDEPAEAKPAKEGRL